MNYDELAFFNQQLGTMLKEGIPLEGAIRQLSSGMQTTPLREELARLADELSQGRPLAEAIRQRELPELYRRMVEVGARSNDLPGVLLLVADYYRRLNTTWTRLKGLLVYPVLVVLAALGVSFFLTVLLGKALAIMPSEGAPITATAIAIWVPPGSLLVLIAIMLAIMAIPRWRSWFRWHLPAVREASLAQLGGTIALMLRNGQSLSDALLFAEQLESGSPAARVLRSWRNAIASGRGKPSQWKEAHSPFPGLFVWLVQNRGNDVAGGFQSAADIFQGRANHRIEMLLYGALPLSVLLLGQMVVWQALPVVQTVVRMMNYLGDMGNI